MNKNSATRTPSDYELWGRLDATAFAISRLRELELAPLGLTVEQAALLRHIQGADRGTTIKRVMHATLRQQHSISILVNRMVRAGLVEKQRSPGDRESRILLTHRGHDVLKKVSNNSIDAVFAVLAPEDKEPFACSLRSLHEKARSMLVPDTPPFIQYVATGESPETTGEQLRGRSRFSGYQLWATLDATRFAISRLRELELSRFGLTVEQSSILMGLAGLRAAVKTKYLEDATLRQHHSVSTLINRMMRMGLVAKERRPGERGYRISITDTGRDLLGQITTAAIDVTFRVLSERDKRRLAAALFLLYGKARDLLGLPLVPSQKAASSSRPAAVHSSST